MNAKKCEIKGFSTKLSIIPFLNRTFTIWCGHNYGKLTVFEFKTDTFESRQFNLSHTNCGAEIAVSILANSQNSIYSYPSPGCVLYQWSTLSKKILNQLDCLKLVPCSESLGSISIDKNLSVGRCQVIYRIAFSYRIVRTLCQRNLFFP